MVIETYSFKIFVRWSIIDKQPHKSHQREELKEWTIFKTREEEYWFKSTYSHLWWDKK